MAIKELNKECCGCAACVDICPKDAISMREDQETFRYPVIDYDKCINCGLCEKTCPLNFSDFQGHDSVDAYVGKYKSEKVIYDSSSGGAFTALYQTLIKAGYVVYGAQYFDHLKVAHGKAVSEQECEKFRKSKYVQSDTEGVFKSVEHDLREGKSVCFSGVSCQCAALISYLDAKKVNRDHLVTVNILCHGVPSQAIFDKYIEEEEKKESARVLQFRFKNKETGNNNKVDTRTAQVEFSNGHKYIHTRGDDPFLRGYYFRLFYRPSCGVCHFTCKERITDITIADAWGIEKIKPEYKTGEGLSLILFNTEKAKEYLGSVESLMDLEKVPSEWTLTSQGLFSKPTDMHKNREKFFKLWEKKSFRSAVFTCTATNMKQKLWLMIPYSIRSKIRSAVKG